VSARVAFLFPAFGMRYRGGAEPAPPGYDEERDRLFDMAAGIVPLSRPGNAGGAANEERGVSLDPAAALRQSLDEHYRSFIASCALAAVVGGAGIPCSAAAGYSMGLFAALHHTGAVSFEDGLRLIEHVVTVAHGVLDGGDYGMGAAIGLTRDEVQAVVRRGGCAVEIADVNAERVIVVAGTKSEVERTLALSADAGCLATRMLPVTLPFHSSWMGPAKERIRAFLPRIEIGAPRCDLVSALGGQLLGDEGAVAEELCSNIVSPLDWLGTMRTLLGLGVDTVVECGFSESLCKVATGLDGALQAYHPKTFPQFLGAASQTR